MQGQASRILVIPASIYFIGLVVYQLFGVPGSVEWTIYFKNLHYVGMMGFLIERAIFCNQYRKLYTVYAISLIVIFLKQLFYIGDAIEVHQQQAIINKPYYSIPFVILILLLTFIVTKYVKK